VDEDILTRILGPEDRPFSPEVARFFLDMSFTEADQNRIAALSEKANEDALTPAERDELTRFVLLNDFLSIAHSKARQTLKSQTPAA
jgi:hypothetical protein